MWPSVVSSRPPQGTEESFNAGNQGHQKPWREEALVCMEDLSGISVTSLANKPSPTPR